MRGFIKSGLKFDDFWFLGLLILFGNGAISHLLGGGFRYVALVLGFLLICISAYHRIALRTKPINYVFLCGLSLYSSILLIWPYLRGHPDAGLLPTVFSLIIFCLFFAGYFIGRSSRAKGLPTVGLVHLAFIILAAISSYKYLSFVKQMTFAGGGRDLDTGNPVGVAYIFTTFCIVLIYLFILYKSFVVKAVALFGLIFAALIVVSTGSRGAVLWGSVAFFYIFFVLILHGRLRITLGRVLGSMLLVLLGVFLVYGLSLVNYAVAERWDLMAARFTGLFGTLLGDGSDMSTVGRLYKYSYYFNSYDQWLLLGEKGYFGYPHNQFLEIVVRFGLYGVPLLILSLYALFKTIYFSLFNRVKDNLSVEWYLFSLLFIFCYLQSMTSLSLEINRGLWLGMGFLVGYDYKKLTPP